MGGAQAQSAAQQDQVHGLQKQIEELREERGQVAGTERRLQEEVAKLSQERDAARKEIEILNQRLTAQAAEAQKAQAALVAERDLVISERDALASALQEAKEAHEAESTSLSKEFRAVIRQRDETVAKLEGERAAHQQQLDSVQTQASDRAAAESETRNRLEQENGRLRRERDEFGRERDDLRGRIERLFDNQREYLSGVGGVSSALTRRETSRIYSIPTPEPVAVSPSVYVMPKGKQIEKLGFVEAEIVEEAVPPNHEINIDLPRIRPIPVRPPQVRKLS